MNWSNVIFWLPLALTVPLAFGMAIALRRKHPDWHSNKIALRAALPGSITVLVLGFVAYALASQPADSPPDGGGAFLFIFVLLTTAYTAVVFTVGVVAARASLWMRRT